MAFDAPTSVGPRPGQFQPTGGFMAPARSPVTDVGLTALRSAHASGTSSHNFTGTTDVACIAVPVPVPFTAPIPVPLGPVTFPPVMVYPPEPSGQPGDIPPHTFRPESPPEGLDPHHRDPTPPPGEEKKKKKEKKGLLKTILGGGGVTFSTKF